MKAKPEMTTERDKLLERLRYVSEHGVNPSLRDMAKQAADMLSADGAQREPTDQQILDDAHRMCSTYKHSEHANLVAYQFNASTLIPFVRALMAKGGAK